MDVRILIGGDICPIGRNQALFQRGEAERILNELLPEFQSADFVTANLECALIDAETPIRKCGPNRGVPFDCVRGLRAMGITVAGLANNHIMDHGCRGLRTTMRALQEAGIAYVGAGEDVAEAAQPLCLPLGDIRVGIIAVAEHEFSIAATNTPGAHPLNLIEYVRTMKNLNRECDYTIVLLHGGKEHYVYPSPALQQTCRFMVEQGADLVLCQHSHCAGCYEHYQGGHIVYGQGNLVFDRHPDLQGAWNRGFVVKVSIKSRQTAEMDLLPYIQSDERPGVRRMCADEEATLRRDLEARSAQIQEDGFLEQAWRDFCTNKRDLYFSILRGHSRPNRRMNQMTHFADRLYSRTALLALQNVVRCESHREVLQTILSDT